MQHRIERSRAESVAVSGKFVDHPLPIKRLLRCVMQHMQTNKSFEQLLMLHPRHQRLVSSQPPNRAQTCVI
jgi:hypothetical protein